MSGTATVTNNTISNNSQFGLLGVPATNLNLIVGYGSNTFGGNGMDVSGPGLTSMKNNVSAGGVF